MTVLGQRRIPPQTTACRSESTSIHFNPLQNPKPFTIINMQRLCEGRAEEMEAGAAWHVLLPAQPRML
eukprot:363769-Chlamydomonas_euryale.AAC.11